MTLEVRRLAGRPCLSTIVPPASRTNTKPAAMSPGGQGVVEVQVDLARGGVGHTQGGGTHESDAQHAGPKGPDEVDGEAGFFVDVAQVAAQKGAAQLPAVRHPDWLAVQKGPGALLGREDLLPYRVVGDSQHRGIAVTQRDDGAKVGNALGVVAGAVQGVHHPGVGRTRLGRGWTLRPGRRIRGRRRSGPPERPSPRRSRRR